MFYPLVSVIIPTYNREKPLRQTLQSILNQDYPNYEIIVVDQSDSHSPGIISFFEKNKDKIRYYHLNEPNLRKARNFGVSQAKGEILLFCDDDDIMLSKDFIWHHIKNYSSSGIGGVASRRLCNSIKKPFRFFRIKHLGSKAALSGRVFHNYDSDNRGYVYTCSCVPFSIKKDIFKKIGGFDPFFPTRSGYSYGDEDFGYRLRQAKIKIIYEPMAVAEHLYYSEGGCRLKDRVEREYFRFYGAMLFYLKNMPKIFLPYMLFIFFLIAIKKILIPTGSIRKFLYVLSGLWEGYRVYRRNKYKMSSTTFDING